MNKSLTAAATIAVIVLLALTGCVESQNSPSAPATPVVEETATPTETSIPPIEGGANMPTGTPPLIDDSEAEEDLIGGENIALPETAPFTIVYKDFTITCEPNADGINPISAFVPLQSLPKEGAAPIFDCFYAMG